MEDGTLKMKIWHKRWPKLKDLDEKKNEIKVAYFMNSHIFTTTVVYARVRDFLFKHMDIYFWIAFYRPILLPPNYWQNMTEFEYQHWQQHTYIHT